MSNLEHFDISAGENVTLTLHARDRNNAAVSLSGKTIAVDVGRPPNAPTQSAASFTKTGTATVTASGHFTISITPSDTDGRSGIYEHEAKTTDGSGNVAVVSRGRLRIRGDMT